MPSSPLTRSESRSYDEGEDVTTIWTNFWGIKLNIDFLHTSETLTPIFPALHLYFHHETIERELSRPHRTTPGSFPPVDNFYFSTARRRLKRSLSTLILNEIRAVFYPQLVHLFPRPKGLSLTPEPSKRKSDLLNRLKFLQIIRQMVENQE